MFMLKFELNIWIVTECEAQWNAVIYDLSEVFVPLASVSFLNEFIWHKLHSTPTRFEHYRLQQPQTDAVVVLIFPKGIKIAG